MSSILDPLIIFIASNAIYLAIGAVFSTISNEIFSLEKVNNIEKPKYNDAIAFDLRGQLIEYVSISFFIYIVNFNLIILLFIFKYVFYKFLYVGLLEGLEKSIVFFFLINLSWLVSRIIKVFLKYFKMRNQYFLKVVTSNSEEKTSHDL